MGFYDKNHNFEFLDIDRTESRFIAGSSAKQAGGAEEKVGSHYLFAESRESTPFSDNSLGSYHII